MLNWSQFEALSGSSQTNFESLCRSIVWLNFSKHGRFHALANQPGVEFHLEFENDCAIAKSGQWFGWQCKFYEINNGVNIGAARRKQIEDSLSKSLKEISGLTDWVLVTKHTLTKTDQNWFYALNVAVTLHLWPSHELETLMSGHAELLKQTYFGELILDSATLAHMHEVSIMPVKKRWLSEVHQVVDAEREIRKALLELAAWDDLRIVHDRMKTYINLIEADLNSVNVELCKKVTNFCSFAKSVCLYLGSVHELISLKKNQVLRQVLDEGFHVISTEIKKVPRLLRAAKHRAGLFATNLLDDIFFSKILIDDIKGCLELRMIAVIADAGGGKTQLAAQLTCQSSYRPAGIFIRGQLLTTGKTLDNLAQSITIKGYSIPTFEALIAALNASADRAHCKLPIVIDGLNEAEDPRQWKPLLASLQKTLELYPNVLVVCTLRTGAFRANDSSEYNYARNRAENRSSFIDMSLPSDVRRIEIPDFGEDTIAAVQKYLEYYKIEVNELALPLDLLRHPLTLRIFCDVANPTRSSVVGVEAIPGSLSAMFESYIDNAINRIADLSPNTNRYYDQDVRIAINSLGTALGKKHSRSLLESEFRKDIGDEYRTWGNSIVHLMEQEGLILRVTTHQNDKISIIPVYDALGGYIIANSILNTDNFEKWINSEKGKTFFKPRYQNGHPLGEDILRALVGIMPRKRQGKQVWQIINGELKSHTLGLCVLLEATYLDSTTINELKNLITTGEGRRILSRLIKMRASCKHPLNATFLHECLDKMTVRDRDLYWTEWIRANSDHIEFDVRNWTECWQKKEDRDKTDQLICQWILWYLTTTSHSIRRNTTYAIYWFGRRNPKMLFDLVENTLGINDPYVSEGYLAACYGVAMTLYSNNQIKENADALKSFINSLWDDFFADTPASKPIHYLSREYARRIIELTAKDIRGILSKDSEIVITQPFNKLFHFNWPEIDDETDVRAAMHMDFENYTLGNLAIGRSNYDFGHLGYSKIRKQILYRISELGWNKTDFSAIDKDIPNQQDYYGRTGKNRNKVDRYGKKYSWIAYFEMRAWLEDNKILKEEETGRPWDLYIDPSFPLPCKQIKIVDYNLIPEWNGSPQTWIESGINPDLTNYLSIDEIDTKKGPWIVLDGFLSQQHEKQGLGIFAFIKSVLVPKDKVKQFVEDFNQFADSDDARIETSDFYNLFAGEIPWCDLYPATAKDTFEVGYEKYMEKEERKRKIVLRNGIEVLPPELHKIIQIARKEKNDTSSKVEDSISFRDISTVVEVEKKRSRSYPVYYPIAYLNVVGIPLIDGLIHGICLSKKFASLGRFRNIPQTYDLQNVKGEQITINTTYTPEERENSEHMFFIRQDALRTILKKLDMALVIITKGERELKYEVFNATRDKIDYSKCNFWNATELKI